MHACVKGGIGTRSGIPTIEGGYQRTGAMPAARKISRMTELRTKRVTHAQSPYITVGACKLFNSPAYLSCTCRRAFSLSPIFLSLLLVVLRGPGRGSTNYWSPIGAREEDRDQAKRIRVLGAFLSSLVFQYPFRFPFARHIPSLSTIYPRSLSAPSSSFNPFLTELYRFLDYAEA